MKTLTAILLTSALALGAAACSDDGEDIPQAPTLGPQIDRAGRPAISTALIDPFDLPANPDGLKDAYNADGARSVWTTTWADDIAQSLAILDALDSTQNPAVDNCGNQFAFNDGYADLAGVLADDRLLVNASSGTCGEYLALEAGMTDMCGGRTPLDDVVDRSYSVLAAGVLSGIGDGADADDATHSATEFPFLAAPQ